MKQKTKEVVMLAIAGPMIIRANDIKVSTGHRQHISGSGAHNDRRFRRNRTRSAQLRKFL